MRLRWTSKLEKFLHDSNFPCGNVAFDLKTLLFLYAILGMDRHSFVFSLC